MPSKPAAKAARRGPTEPAYAAARFSYGGTMAMLGIAALFPVALMVFNPTLMFERGWEQYVGTAIYAWALVALARELLRARRNEPAFAEGAGWLESGEERGAGLIRPDAIRPDDHRVLPGRVRQLATFAAESRSASVGQLMEVNREASGLDGEEAAGRFTLPKYILYLLPVIGFIGTVEGISKALMNISLVLPMVKDLDGFMNNLTSVTSALQVAFDSTLLALFLSAALMLVQTLVYRRSEDLLARVDRWVVEKVLPRAGGASDHPLAAGVSEALAPHLEAMRRDLIEALAPAVQALQELSGRMGDGLGPHVDRFAKSVDQLPTAFAGFRDGAQAIGRIGPQLARLEAIDDGMRRGIGLLGRIEESVSHGEPVGPPLEEIRREVDRARQAVEGLAESWSASFERSSRASQDQLARTMHSLKDALDLLNVSMEQGNALYRSIVKRTFTTYPTVARDEDAA